MASKNFVSFLYFSWVGDPRYGLLMNPLHNADHLKVVASTTKAILPRLKDFHDILVNPPHVSKLYSFVKGFESLNFIPEFHK